MEINNATIKLTIYIMCFCCSRWCTSYDIRNKANFLILLILKICFKYFKRRTFIKDKVNLSLSNMWIFTIFGSGQVLISIMFPRCYASITRRWIFKLPSNVLIYCKSDEAKFFTIEYKQICITSGKRKTIMM